MPVVDDPDEAPPASLDRDFDRLRASVERFLDEFLDRRRRPLDHLARGDAVDGQRVETANRHGANLASSYHIGRQAGAGWARQTLARFRSPSWRDASHLGKLKGRHSEPVLSDSNGLRRHFRSPAVGRHPRGKDAYRTAAYINTNFYCYISAASNWLVSRGCSCSEPLRTSDHRRMQRAVAERAARGAADALHGRCGDLAVALDEPLRRAALELDMDELRSELGRSVEAERIGADEIGLAFLQFLFVEPVERHVADFGRGDVERFARALVLGRRAAIEIGAALERIEAPEHRIGEAALLAHLAK